MNHLESVINSGLFNEIKETSYIGAYEQLSVTSKRYERNMPIYLEGDLIDKVCIVVQGSIRSEKAYIDGAVRVASIYEEASIFGLEIATSRKQIATLDYICNEDTTVLFISIKSIMSCDYASQIYQSLIHMLSDDNIRMAHKIEILAQRGIRERIMIYLGIQRSKSKGDTFEIKMNREQLSSFLCVNRSALSNELSKMRSEGTIDFHGKVFTFKKL